MKWFRREKPDPLANVARIEALAVRPDDLVIVTVPTYVSAAMMGEAQKVFDQVLRGKGARVLVVHAGTDVSLVRSTEAKVPQSKHFGSIEALDAVRRADVAAMQAAGTWPWAMPDHPHPERPDALGEPFKKGA